MKQNLQVVFMTAPPRLHIFEGAISDLMGKLNDYPHPEMLIRQLNAEIMRTQDGFYDELSHALEFPKYFGRNLNALDECITDLNWLSVSGPILLVIKNSEMLLSNASNNLFEGFLAVFNDAGNQWSCPVEEGEEWDRPALPFHVIFQVESNTRKQFEIKLQKFSVQIGEIE
ncbi:MAG: barstar family protein [Anaerohalosphaeraceae bacterium]